MDQRLGVFRVGLGKRLILLERLVELVVAEQRRGKRIHGLQVAGLQVVGALIGGDGVLGLLQLVVKRAQRELHLGRAAVHGNSFNRLHGMLHVAAFGVEPRQVQHHLFRLGLDGLGGLELCFGLVLAGASRCRAGPAPCGLPRSWAAGRRSSRIRQSPGRARCRSAKSKRRRSHPRPAGAGRCGPAACARRCRRDESSAARAP